MEGGAPRGSPDQVPFSLQIQTFWEIVLGGGGGLFLFFNCCKFSRRRHRTGPLL